MRQVVRVAAAAVTVITNAVAGAGLGDSDAILRSPQRFEATRQALSQSDSAAGAVEYVVSALASEIETPAPGFLEHGYVTNTEFFQLQYLKMLTDLGRQIVPILAERSTRDSDRRVTDLIVTARAMLGDETVYDEIMTNVQDTNKDPFLRMLAVRSLGFLGRRDSIPMLKGLLKDDYFREASISTTAFRIYLLREEACGSLQKLGVRMSRKGNEFKVLDEKAAAPAVRHMSTPSPAPAAPSDAAGIGATRPADVQPRVRPVVKETNMVAKPLAVSKEPLGVGRIWLVIASIVVIVLCAVFVLVRRICKGRSNAVRFGNRAS